MALKAKIDNGTLKDITTLYTNINGNLRKITAAYSNVGGSLQQVYSAAEEYVTYGVRISLNTSNPQSAVTYTDDAVGMTGGSSAWDEMPIYREIRPCILKDGAVEYYLNLSDFTKKSDGTASDIHTGTDGDVMIEFPKVGFKIESSGNYLYVKITNDPNAEGYSYAAFRRYAGENSSVYKNHLYLGAYLGYVMDGKLRSLSGYSPSRSITMDSFRTYAHEKGNGYGLQSFYAVTLLQCLYLIRYKTLDSQTACGFGASNTNLVRYNTGGTKYHPMFYAGTSTYPQIKVFGIEDLWGNQQTYLDGIGCDSNWNFIVNRNHEKGDNCGVDSYPSGVDISETWYSIGVGSYMSKPQGSNELGFLLKEWNANESTYFCDAPSIYPGRIAVYGGSGDGMYQNGIFAVGLCISDTSGNYPYSNTSARLMYL